MTQQERHYLGAAMDRVADALDTVCDPQERGKLIQVILDLGRLSAFSLEGSPYPTKEG